MTLNCYKLKFSRNFLALLHKIVREHTVANLYTMDDKTWLITE